MKKYLVILSALILMMVCTYPSYAAKKSDGEGKIRFSNSSHNFGVIKEKGGPVSVKFEFLNEGNAPLVIKDVRAQCGCTRPSYPKKPIAPGKKGVIEVTYNPLGRPGSFTKTVTVNCTGKPSKQTLKITGRVTPEK